MPEIDMSFDYINEQGLLEGYEPKKPKRYKEIAEELTTRFLTDKTFTEERLQAALRQAAIECCDENRD